MTYKVKATIETEKGVRNQTTLLFSPNLTTQVIVFYLDVGYNKFTLK